jgi:hypothetical protein
MAKKARPDAHSEPTTDAQKQAYDNVLKRLVEKQADSVIPLLLGPLATEVIEELNIEMLIPPRRSDRAYKTRSDYYAMSCCVSGCSSGGPNPCRKSSLNELTGGYACLINC